MEGKPRYDLYLSAEAPETEQKPEFIHQRVSQLLSELDTVSIVVQGHEPIELVAELRKLPRSGHMVRIERDGLDLPKQSLYDHVLTLGEIADTLKNSTSLSEADQELVAGCIVSHDLAELLIGDIPDYTPQELAAEILKNRITENEDDANIIIAASLPDSLRQKFEVALQLLKDETHDLTRFFLMVDKIEPILSMWRYIHTCRDQMNIDQFLESMSDFFTNPQVVTYCLTEETQEVAKFFQNPENARRYYNGAIDLQSETPLVKKFIDSYIDKSDIRFTEVE